MSRHALTVASLTLFASLSIAAPALAGANPSEAIFVDFSNYSVRFATQTSAAAPTAIDFYTVNQRLSGSNLTPAELGTATVSSLATGSRTLTPLPGGNFGALFGAQVASEAELSSLLPTGDYTFNITGGLAGPGSGVVTQPELYFWSSIPHVTNWAALQNAAPTLPIQVTYAAPVLDPLAISGGVFWSLFNNTTEQFITSGFNAFSDPTSLVINNAFLASNTTYRIEIDFSARQDFPNGDLALAPAFGQVSFDSITRTTFTTIPSPAASTLLALSTLAIARRRSQSSKR